MKCRRLDSRTQICSASEQWLEKEYLPLREWLHYLRSLPRAAARKVHLKDDFDFNQSI
jgi:hypothetical protein